MITSLLSGSKDKKSNGGSTNVLSSILQKPKKKSSNKESSKPKSSDNQYLDVSQEESKTKKTMSLGAQKLLESIDKEKRDKLPKSVKDGQKQVKSMLESKQYHKDKRTVKSSTTANGSNNKQVRPPPSGRPSSQATSVQKKDPVDPELRRKIAQFWRDHEQDDPAAIKQFEMLKRKKDAQIQNAKAREQKEVQGRKQEVSRSVSQGGRAQQPQSKQSRPDSNYQKSGSGQYNPLKPNSSRPSSNGREQQQKRPSQQQRPSQSRQSTGGGYNPLRPQEKNVRPQPNGNGKSNQQRAKPNIQKLEPPPQKKIQTSASDGKRRPISNQPIYVPRAQLMKQHKKEQRRKHGDYDDYDDYDDEYDSDDGFICDDDEEEVDDYTREMDQMFGTYRNTMRRRRHWDDADIQEASYDQMQAEDAHTARIGRQEDEEQLKYIQKEQEQEMRSQQKKKKN